MNYQSIIRNLAYCSDERLALMKKEIGIEMSADALQFCIQHYENKERRDPHVDELRMLSNLCAAQETAPASYCPSDFFTNDDAVAQTYRDLLGRREVDLQGRKKPLTLSAIANAATTALLRAKKPDALSATSPLAEYIPDAKSTLANGCIFAPQAFFRLRPTALSYSPPQKGELLLLLPQGSFSACKQQRLGTDALLNSQKLRPFLCGVDAVETEGILQTLLATLEGAWLDLRAFSPDRLSMPATVLTDDCRGDLILRIDAKGLTAVLEEAKRQNLYCFAFGAVSGDNRYTFSREDGVEFSLQTQFLQTLFHYKNVCAKLSDERSDPPRQLFHGAISARANAYLSAEAQAAEESARMGMLLCTAATATAQDSFFLHAVYAILAPVLSLAACGATTEEQRLSIGVELPPDLNDPYVTGNAFSLLLGIYRAQMELAVTADPIRPRFSARISAPVLSVFSRARKDTPLPSRFTEKDARVYCLAPRICKNGLPDFADLRAMIKTLSTISKEGKVLSAVTLCGDSVTDGIRRMNGSIRCNLTDTSLAAQEPLPLAILLESREKLPFREVGFTQASTDAFSSEMTSIRKASLIWSEQPSVLLLSHPDDTDAYALASLLEERGAAVTHFTDAENESDRIARALLGSQYLLLCKGVTLPNTPRLTFSLDTFRRAGGVPIRLCGESDPDEGVLELKKGLSRTDLQEIAPFLNKISKK